MVNKAILGVGILGLHLALAQGQSVWADAQLRVPEGVELMAVDEQEYDSGLFAPKLKIVTLTPGAHQIIARFNQLYDLNADEHDVLKSSPVILNLEAQDQQVYTLTALDVPRDYVKAKRYAKAPLLEIRDKTGTVIVSKQGVPGQELSLMRRIEKSVNAAIKQEQGETPKAPPTRLEQFQFIWNQANPAERSAIREWLGKQ